MNVEDVGMKREITNLEESDTMLRRRGLIAYHERHGEAVTPVLASAIRVSAHFGVLQECRGSCD